MLQPRDNIISLRSTKRQDRSKHIIIRSSKEISLSITKAEKLSVVWIYITEFIGIELEWVERERPYPVDPWVVGIVEVEVGQSAFDHQQDYSLELEIDLELGWEMVHDLELETGHDLVRVIDHAEQIVAIPLADFPMSIQTYLVVCKVLEERRLRLGLMIQEDL